MPDKTRKSDPNPQPVLFRFPVLSHRVAVLGAGAWGTALAAAFQRSGLPTRLWARRADVADAINTHHRSPSCLTDIDLPRALVATADLAHALADATLVVLAVPSSATRALACRIAPHLTPGTLVLCASKGIEQDTGALMTQVLDASLGDAALNSDTAQLGDTVLTGSLTGPSFAAEVARGQTTLLTLAMDALDPAHPQHPRARRLADSLVRTLASAQLVLTPTADTVGAQVGGALKNTIAIACGMAVALELGENARAGILTRGLDDMRRLTLALGGRVETLLGSCGVGDLFLTASSTQSRNTRLGIALGQGRADAVNPHGELSEGAVSVMTVECLERELGVTLHVAAAVRAVLERRASPADALDQLLHGQTAQAARPAAALTSPQLYSTRPSSTERAATSPHVSPRQDYLLRHGHLPRDTRLAARLTGKTHV